MIAAMRSELVRIIRPRLLAGWFGLTAVFAILINVVMFSTVGDAGAMPEQGPGVAFPDVATLGTADGLVVGLSAASSMFGVVTLSFWAIATATDYSSGLIRLLAAAQPRRWTLLAGKVLALMIVTAAATLALVVNPDRVGRRGQRCAVIRFSCRAGTGVRRRRPWCRHGGHHAPRHHRLTSPQ